MNGLFDLPPELSATTATVAAAIERVVDRFDDHLRSDLPPVSGLVRHVEHYRGKMLRPTLVLLCGLTVRPPGSAFDSAAEIPEANVTTAAVCEMVHMATLVHDDVLDEAEVRRRGLTVNRLHGNEPAVILGDYLIAAAYHLCSQIDGEAGRYSSLAIGRASMVMCAGELLQLHHRDDFSLDEATYFEIIDRKTAELIATSCELGAYHGGADPDLRARLRAFGRKLGVAFQIQDDLLDLMGDESTVGKSVNKDLEKGKMTLPLIHHLAHANPRARGETLLRAERAVSSADEAAPLRRQIREALESTGSIVHAREAAGRLVAEAKAAIGGIGDSPAKRVLLMMADAVVDRAY